MLILSFYLMFYDFLLYIFLYFCVVNTAIFFHFISRNVGLDIDEIVCLLDSQLWF
jgi:hypothetical protein